MTNDETRDPSAEPYWTADDPERPLDWRLQLGQRCARTGWLPPPDADVIVQTFCAYAWGVRGKMPAPDAAARSQLSLLFRKARAGSLFPTRRFFAEVWLLAGFRHCDIARRLKLTPEELAAYEAIYFDLEGRADDEQFLLAATALPELGLLPDRRADHRTHGRWGGYPRSGRRRLVCCARAARHCNMGGWVGIR